MGRIGKGSCTVSLERISSVEDDQKPMDVGDEFDEAGDLVDESLRALTTDSWFPSNMPKSVLPMFNEWGKTLGEEESIALGENIDDAPMYNAAISKRLKARLSQPGGCTGRCELSGEIRAASLRADEGGTFTIRRDDGLTLSGVFADDQKSDLIGALRDHEAVRVWLTGEGEYGMDGELVKILRVDSYNIVPVGEVPFDPDAPSILDIVDEIRASMSETAFESMPTDGSINLKHYLYGWPEGAVGVKVVFADSNYWVAIINPRDQLHDRARRVTADLGESQIVTSEMVLVEVLNHFSRGGSEDRELTVEFIRRLRSKPNVEVIPQTSDQFHTAVARYAASIDQSWGMVDCSSFILMEERGIQDALAHDRDFVQAGFNALLRQG